MLMMLPPWPCSRMRCATDCATRQAPVKLTSTTPDHSSSDSSRHGLVVATPALLTRMRMAPSSRSTLATALATLSGRITSMRTTIASPPLARISVASRLPPSTRAGRPARLLAPAAASVSAKWRPRPLNAPVTSAQRPLTEVLSTGQPSERTGPV